MSADLDMYGDVEELDGLGDPRRRLRRLAMRARRTRNPRKRARIMARMKRIASRSGITPPGRRRTTMQTYKLPDGQVVCPGPGTIVHISDEPIFEKQYLTNPALWVSPRPFFTASTRTTNGEAISSLLQAGEVSYDVDVEAIGLSYYPVDQGTAALNQAMQQFFEYISRSSVLLKIQSKTNYLFPAVDCPAGTGIAARLATTETNMRLVSIQNGDQSKGRRRLPHPIALRANTKFGVELILDATNLAAVQALAVLTNPIGVGVTLYGPEGQPLVPAAAGGLLSPSGIMQAADFQG